MCLSKIQKTLKSEREFVNTLLLLSNLQQELRRASDKGKLLSSNDVTAIFSNVESLLVLHQEFLSHLEKLRANWPTATGIARAFLSVAEAFKVYAEYTENHQNSRRTLTTIKERKPKYWAAILDLATSVGFDNSHDFFQMLTEPIGRMKKYETMFEEQLNDLTNNGPSFDDHERDQVITAFGLVQHWSDLLRKKLDNSHARARVLNIQNKLSGNVSLFVEGRDLYTEGILNRPKKGKKFHLFLFTDMLLITKPKRNSEKLKVIDIADLAQVEVSIPNESRNTKDSLHIKTPTCVHNMSDLSAKCVSWLNDISELSRKKKNKVFGVELQDVMEQQHQLETEKELHPFSNHTHLHTHPGPLNTTLCARLPTLSLSQVPLTVVALINWLRKHDAARCEGILRVSGSSSKVMALKNHLDRTLHPKEVETAIPEDLWETPHDIASVLKFYFKELPTPLLTFNLYHELLNTQKGDLPTEARLSTIRSLILHKLASENRALLQYLVDYLYELQLLSSINFMNVQNLAIVITPNVLRPREATLQSAMDGPYLLGVMEMIIEFRDRIFGDEFLTPDHEAPPKPPRISSPYCAAATSLVSMNPDYLRPPGYDRDSDRANLKSRRVSFSSVESSGRDLLGDTCTDSNSVKSVGSLSLASSFPNESPLVE
eukprot:TRINITY_DN1347_c0_g1_i2.p1 TRINITY_DN1347_c0_g1~~TRINITY_DN1347_c0_g1_i2.p1  ORF type:complete len:658 (+),score=108.39 TRINITY_DN1347_c0_g1_i2:692-2665(+)